MFHPEILTDEQQKILPLVKHFNKNYYLVGGTAIALQIGHRHSIDFDLFTKKSVQRNNIKETILQLKYPIDAVIHEEVGQIHLVINSVKMTFFNFPYFIPQSVDFNKIIKMPSLLDLAAMKAFAFAQRAKWKDYVDIYFLLKRNYTIEQISQRTEELFNIGGSVIFSEKLFRQQLCFFKNIDYSEPVEYMINPVSENEIKNFLTEVSVSSF